MWTLDRKVSNNVADPDPNPPDPHVLGPPWSGSGSISQRYVSGFFYHKAKIVRKTLIFTVLWLLFDFLSLKSDVKVPSKSNMQNFFFLNSIFLLASWRSMMKVEGSGSASGSRSESGFGSVCQRLGSADTDSDPDPYQNVMDLQHWLASYIIPL